MPRVVGLDLRSPYRWLLGPSGGPIREYWGHIGRLANMIA